MKLHKVKYIGTIFLFFLFFFNTAIANEDYLFKFHNLKVYSITGNKLNNIGSSSGRVEEYPYSFEYHLKVKNGSVSELIETFYFENYGDYMSRFNDFARSVVYRSNPKNGCNNSINKIYHVAVDNGPIHFNCFSFKIISNEEDIYGPNFNKVQHINMHQRKKFLNKYIKKNQIIVPNQMFRIESYFYKSGKLIWIFYTLDANLFYDELNEENIQKFVNTSIQVHQNFEKNLKYKNHMKISILSPGS